MLTTQKREALAALISPCDVDAFIEMLNDCGFRAEKYLEFNADLRDVGLDADAALFHFLAQGHKEKRQIPVGDFLQGIGSLYGCEVEDRAYLIELCQTILTAQTRKREKADKQLAETDLDLVARIRAAGGSPYFVLGDSHSDLYVRPTFGLNGWFVPLHVLCSGASALSLSDENSKSGYRSRMLNWASAIAGAYKDFDVPVLLKFGQLDVEFVWALRRSEKGTITFSLAEFNEFAAESVRRYSTFIDSLCGLINPAVIRVLSIFPPTLSDETWAEGYVNGHVAYLETDGGLESLSAQIRKLEIPNLEIRTQLHELYNLRLQRMCTERKIEYVDDFHIFLGPTNTADPKFFPNHAGTDHHLSFAPSEEPIIEIIEQQLALRSPQSLSGADRRNLGNPGSFAMKIAKEVYRNSRPWIDMNVADVGRYIATTTAKADFDLSQKLRQWQDDGIVIFEQAISHQLIDQLLDDIDRLKAHPTEYDLGVEFRGNQQRLRDFTSEQLDLAGIKFNQLHQLSAAAALLSISPTINQFLRHIFLAEPAVLQSLAFLMGSQQPIHVDYPYVNIQQHIARMAASWIPLENIHPDSGPLAYYPGSHKLDKTDFFDWGEGSIILDVESQKTPMDFAHFLRERMDACGIAPLTFCPRKGDVLIWHANVCHEGTAIKDLMLTRKSYVTHYTSLDSHPDGSQRHAAILGQQCIWKNGGWVFLQPGNTTEMLMVGDANR